MRLFWWLLVLLIGRLIGLPVLAVWFLLGILANTTLEGRLPSIVLMGVLADLLIGTRFGVNSLLFVLIALEVTFYREKVGLSTPWPLALLALLSTAQAVIIWQYHMGFWVYALSMPLCIAFGLLGATQSGQIRGKGIYLRGAV